VTYIERKVHVAVRYSTLLGVKRPSTTNWLLAAGYCVQLVCVYQ
jgi:hypothetical protein